MSIVKFCNQKIGGRSLENALSYISRPDAVGDSKLISKGLIETYAYECMIIVKGLYHKMKQRDYIHLIVSPEATDIEPGIFRDIVKDICYYKKFKGYQALAAIHTNTEHLHTHIILNSVNANNGKKFQQSPSDLDLFKNFVEDLFKSYGFVISVDYEEIDEEYDCEDDDYEAAEEESAFFDYEDADFEELEDRAKTAAYAISNLIFQYQNDMEFDEDDIYNFESNYDSCWIDRLSLDNLQFIVENDYFRHSLNIDDHYVDIARRIDWDEESDEAISVNSFFERKDEKKELGSYSSKIPNGNTKKYADDKGQDSINSYVSGINNLEEINCGTAERSNTDNAYKIITWDDAPAPHPFIVWDTPKVKTPPFIKWLK